MSKLGNSTRAASAAQRFNVSAVHAGALSRAIENILLQLYPEHSVNHVKKMANSEMLATLDRIKAELEKKNGHSTRKD